MQAQRQVGAGASSHIVIPVRRTSQASSLTVVNPYHQRAMQQGWVGDALQQGWVGDASNPTRSSENGRLKETRRSATVRRCRKKGVHGLRPLSSDPNARKTVSGITTSRRPTHVFDCAHGLPACVSMRSWKRGQFAPLGLLKQMSASLLVNVHGQTSQHRGATAS